MKTTEKTDGARHGGCFDKSSQVITPSGNVSIADVRIGDSILAVNSKGEAVFSPVILFLDRDPNATRLYYTITTTSGRSISLTGSHLIFVIEDEVTALSNLTSNAALITQRREQFARQIVPNQLILIRNNSSQELQVERVVSVVVEEKSGAFAPLTAEGNLIVNQALASCYANINSQSLAHYSFLPVRMYSHIVNLFNYLITMSPHHQQGHSRTVTDQVTPPTVGIHWYPRMLMSIANLFLPSRFMD